RETSVERTEIFGSVLVRFGVDRRRASLLEGDERRSDVRDGNEPADARGAGRQDPSVAAPHERDPVPLRVWMATGRWELDVDGRLANDTVGDAKGNVGEDLPAGFPSQYGAFHLSTAEGRDR